MSDNMCGSHKLKTGTNSLGVGVKIMVIKVFVIGSRTSKRSWRFTWETQALMTFSRHFSRKVRRGKPLEGCSWGLIRDVGWRCERLLLAAAQRLQQLETVGARLERPQTSCSRSPAWRRVSDRICTFEMTTVAACSVSGIFSVNASHNIRNIREATANERTSYSATYTFPMLHGQVSFCGMSWPELHRYIPTLLTSWTDKENIDSL